MTRLPDTTTTKPKRTGSAVYAAVFAATLAAILLVVLLRDGGDTPPPGEEVYAAGVEDIAVGTGDAPFPRSDAGGFDGGTQRVRVYLRVEDMANPGEMVATVERSGRSSLLSRAFGGRGVRAEGGEEDRLSASGDGVSGVVSFDVWAEDGGPLPAGGYEVEVRSRAGDEEGSGRPVARKYFVVGDPQA